LTTRTFYVISAVQAQASDKLNKENTAVLGQYLRSLGTFHKAEGVYNGQREDSFIIELDEPSNECVIRELGALYKQECILKIYGSGESYLLYDDGKKEYVGEMRAASGDTSAQHDNATYVKSSDVTLYTR
jgi:hypothetical protein